MCGIVGFYLPNSSPDPTLLHQMNAAIRHRGPDGEGYFTAGPVGLAMRRLAIIDLHTGDQPLFNEDGTVAVVFNGEIYNYRQLRAELIQQGHHFKTQSDTEVLAHGYEAWGDDLPTHLNGMFAFAVWDMKQQRLLLARDHLGIKPLYYAELPGGGLAFASELKALLSLPDWSREVDPLALDWYLATRYIPAPRTIYQGARKLPPAHCLVAEMGYSLQLRRYWDVTFAPPPVSAETAKPNLTAEEWQAGLRDRLTRAVSGQLVSDVPLGAFLSGGIDSSIVVGLMAQATSQPVRTFSVVFPGWAGFDESHYARQVAQRFNTQHTEIAVETDIGRDWPELIQHLDEPFADPASLPTWLMARETRRHVTVVLTGEGADELFAGYNWYGWTQPWAIPITIRQPLRRLAQYWLSGRRGRHTATAHLSPDFATFYTESVLSSVTQAEERKRLYQPGWLAHLHALAPQADLGDLFKATARHPWQSRIQELDLKIWLEGDPLVKADRTTMLASLEGRVPMLDVEVVEWAAQVPPQLHRQNGVSKTLLRAAFSDLLPEAILHRSKHAFDVPISAWLRGPLRPALTAALADTSLQHILHPKPIRAMAQAHWDRHKDFGRELWALLHLAAWWQHNQIS